jgi:hypothetical protein
MNYDIDAIHNPVFMILYLAIGFFSWKTPFWNLMRSMQDENKWGPAKNDRWSFFLLGIFFVLSVTFWPFVWAFVGIALLHAAFKGKRRG